MSELDKAVEQLKSEGYSSKEIQKALSKLSEDTTEDLMITKDLDDYLDSLEKKEDKK
jgi:Holliday junction resolvasome RuvABC DNA-binding subunit